jgi:hypothetical protein
MDKVVTELPVLRLGLIGFAAPQQALLDSVLASMPTPLRWRLAELSQADAICANGARAIALADGSFQIGPSAAGAAPARIDLNASDRPLAFSIPLALRGFTAPATVDLTSSASIRAMLEKFEGWLRPMTVQFCLASRIVQERLDVRSTVFHVSVNGRLQAVVSPRNGMGVLPIADPAGLSNAVWARRPGTADDIPGHFIRAGLAEVMWQYAMRTTRDLLAPSLRSGLIYWCRAPQLPQRLFDDAHLMIVRELAHAPSTFAELALRTKLAEPVLARCVLALCIVGAVTLHKERASRAAEEAGGAVEHEEEMSSDRTVPAPLLPYWN